MQPANYVQLELGTEWIVSDVVDRLAELSEEKPIWMDQLCIPQQEDKILQTLADIQSIFSTLDVVVFCPGSLCGCIPKIVEKLSRIPSEDPGQKDSDQQSLAFTGQYNKCLGTGSFSWSQRMWPHQEVMHAQRIRCIWASKVGNPCVKLHDPDINVEDLPPFQRRMFETLIENGVSQDRALNLLSTYLLTTDLAMNLDLSQYFRDADHPHAERRDLYFRFMLGEQFNKSHDSATGAYTTEKFLLGLSREAGAPFGAHRTRRKATRPRDYIISLWTACPKYTIPPE